jgi:hypothetical protein
MPADVSSYILLGVPRGARRLSILIIHRRAANAFRLFRHYAKKQDFGGEERITQSDIDSYYQAVVIERTPQDGILRIAWVNNDYQ